MDGEDPDSPGDPATALRELGELGLIQRVRRRLPRPGPAVRVGLGDDTAVVEWPADRLLLLTTDTLVEDVHFRRATATLRDVGAKALAVNLSDIAAMGGEPRFALLALACPPDCGVADLDELYAGLLETAAPHGVDLIGGDTCTAPDRLVLTITLAGAADGPPLTRGGARPGDAILVTGTLGGSAAGLATLERPPAGVPAGALAELARAHRRPTPRVAEGRAIRATGGATAMIDLSDGLATDLGHIAAESRVGARVRLASLPVSDATRAAARALREEAWTWAVSGGEDYELLFTAAPDRADALAARVTAETGTRVTRIGEVRPAGEGVVFLDEAGQPVAVRPGFEHFK
jgi:thiamine-monophosphate kinase